MAWIDKPDATDLLAQGKCPLCGGRFDDAAMDETCDHAADDYRLMLAYLAPSARGPWSCARCGDQFSTQAAAQLHADACTNPTMRVGQPM